MIVHTYSAFRATFGFAGDPLAADGHKVWRPGLLRDAGFTGFVTPTIVAYPFALTCNAEAADAVLGVHEYDWYLSQRTDVAADQCLTIEHDVPAKSGRVRLNIVGPQVARILPGLSGADLLTASSQRLIFKHVHLYVHRRSDDAYQWIRLVTP